MKAISNNGSQKWLAYIGHISSNISPTLSVGGGGLDA